MAGVGGGGRVGLPHYPFQSFYIIKLLPPTKVPFNILTYQNQSLSSLNGMPLERQAIDMRITKDSGIRGIKERATQSGRLMKLKVSNGTETFS